MDPNETLRLLRLRAEKLQKLMDRGTSDFELDTATQEMLDSWKALDEWLSKGGFLPSDWRSTSKLQQCVICKRMKLVCCSDRRAPPDQCVNPRCEDCCKHEVQFQNNVLANQNNRGE